MDMITQELEQWLNSLPARHPVAWEQLPDIGLYMDQVLTYVDRQLVLYRQSGQEHVLTPAMINNYIKDGLIPRAEAKKYSPGHLALLIMIGTLKQVLSIQNLKDLLSECRNPDEIEALYHHFLSVQQKALLENAAQVLAETGKIQIAQVQVLESTFARDLEETNTEKMETKAKLDVNREPKAEAIMEPTVDDKRDASVPGQNRKQKEALRSLALELAIEARVRILIAERILSMLDQTAPPEQKDKPDRKKRGT
jgi:hypothetical protein